MKSPKSDSIEKSEDLNSNNKKCEESSKKEKAKEIYFIILYKKKQSKKKMILFSQKMNLKLKIYIINGKKKKEIN